VPLLATNASQILVAAPAQSDGTQTITITDPVSGAFSIMTNVLTIGAASTDNIVLLQGANPPTLLGRRQPTQSACASSPPTASLP